MITLIRRGKWAIIEVMPFEIMTDHCFSGYVLLYNPEEFVSQRTGETYWRGDFEMVFKSIDSAYAFIKENWDNPDQLEVERIMIPKDITIEQILHTLSLEMMIEVVQVGQTEELLYEGTVEELPEELNNRIILIQFINDGKLCIGVWKEE